MTGSPMIFQLKRIYLPKKQGSTYVSATSFHILSKAQATLKQMERIKNTVDMAQFFMLSQMVVRSFYFVVLEAIAFRPNKPHHKNGFEIGNFFVFHDD